MKAALPAIPVNAGFETGTTAVGRGRCIRLSLAVPKSRPLPSGAARNRVMVPNEGGVAGKADLSYALCAKLLLRDAQHLICLHVCQFLPRPTRPYDVYRLHHRDVSQTKVQTPVG